MQAKILELFDLKDRFEIAKKEHEDATKVEEAACSAYYGQLHDMIDKGVVKVNQVYMINGKAVVFRKRRIDDRDYDRPHYDYSFEILPVENATTQSD
jgi:hypothetical protein